MATKVKKERRNVPASAQAVTPAADNPLINNAKLKQLYAAMLQCRILNEHTQPLNKISRKSSSHLGREAAVVGAAIDLRHDDWLLPLQGDLFANFIKGEPLSSLLSRIGPGKPPKRSPAKAATKGATKSEPSPFHILPVAANAAAQLRLASGLALAFQVAKSSNVVMAFFSETAGEGQRWQEALTFAGERCLPLLVVLLGDASSKASSTYNDKSSANFLDKDHVCGVPVIAVDAEDVVAMYRVAYESIHKARHGGGPTVVLAVSFPETPKGSGKGAKMIAGHHPGAIARMESYLAAKGLFSESWKQKLIDDFSRRAGSAARPSPRNR